MAGAEPSSEIPTETPRRRALALLEAGDAASAAPLLQSLLAETPHDVVLRANLGVALHRLGDLAGAIASFREVVALRPDLAAVQANLGVMLGGKGDIAGAMRAFEAALVREPERVDWIVRLGELRAKAGKDDVAESLFERALALEPDNMPALVGRAELRFRTGRHAEAEADFNRILARAPDTAAAWNALGLIASGRNQADAALAHFRRAVALEPDLAPALVNLGSNLIGRHALSEALDVTAHAVDRDPKSIAGYLNLSVALINQGRAREAAIAAARAVELAPKDNAPVGNLLAALQYDPERDAATRTRQALEWGRNAVKVPQLVLPPRDRDPERKLRIGYLSGDFRAHPVGLYLLGVLPHHDRSGFHVACYVNQKLGDAVTHSLQGSADAWISAAGLDDASLARRIAADGIDILIDLSGHTAGGRLGALARRPAPVQAAWIGYFATTGLPTVDWIIADARLVPPDEYDQYSERKLLLPDTYVTFAPPADSPVPARPPLFGRGHVTFGCFNNAAKLGPPVLALWAQILNALPDARLALRTGAFGDRGTIVRFRNLFAAAGVDPSRIDFAGHAPRRDLLGAYNGIDIALDPFPFNGGITTVEALWMGVPVVSKKGDRYCGHHSESSLVSLGLGDLVAPDSAGYVQTALALARDPARLDALRGDMRARFARSTLGDNPRFVRDLEAALRVAWRDWCRRPIGDKASA